MKIVVLLLGLTLLVGKACGDPPNTDTDTGSNIPSFELASSFELGMKEKAENTANDLTIQFLEVTEDSRCPTNTDCVWEGQAKINFLVNGDPVEVILQEGKPELAEKPLADGEHMLMAESLTPYPDGKRINPSTYRVQVSVTKLEP